MPRDMVVLESAANPIKAPVASSESMAASDRQARKRELDRLCQRRKRKKDRDLIDRLQARINDLQKQADGGHFNSLLIDRENRQALTARHSERMMKIQALVLEDLGDVVNGGSKSPDLERGESAPAVGQQDNTDILSNTPHVLTAPLETVEDHHQQQVAEMAQSLTDRGLAGVTYGSVPFGLQDFNIASTNPSRLPYANVSFGQLGSILDGGDMSKHDNTGLLTVSTTCGECESHWTRTNDILLQARRSRFHTWPAGSDLDASIIITAVTSGWDMAQRHFDLDPLWECLRLLDEINFSIGGKIERIATLRILRNLLMCQVSPGLYNGEPIPQFYKPRPSQLNVKHPAVADYFVWPSFREHFVFAHSNFCKNVFSRMFNISYRFLWPFEIRDAYTRNTLTGLLSFSSAFTNRLGDVRCWAMTRDFITAYPEFEGDVPLFEPQPTHLSLGVTRFEKEKYVRQRALTHSNAEDEAADEDMLRQASHFNPIDWLG